MQPPGVRLPLGVRDFLPRAASRRREIAERLLAVFESWGYARLITPAYECADVLERGLGADARAAAIRFVEPASGEVVALRTDITPQVARVVASRLAEAPGPLRLCYEGAVTRLVAGAGQREILQAGIELIEVAAPLGDAELVAVAAAAMEAMGLAERQLDLGHVAFAQCVLEAAPTAEHREKLRQALARKDRRAVARLAEALPVEQRPLALALVELWGPARTVLERARPLPWPAPARLALEHLEQVLVGYRDIAGAAALDGDVLGIDLGEVRGFEYYTGLRLAGYVGGAPEAVLSGGRYDRLIGYYGRPAPATGFSVDIEAIALAQRALGLPPARRGVWLALSIEPSLARTAALARALRAAGARVALAPAQASWPAFLRGANLDAALVLGQERLVLAAGGEEPLDAALLAAVAQADAGHAHPLLELVTARISRT